MNRKILIISDQIPMPDRSSGDLRFYTLLKLIAETHQVVLSPIKLDWQRKTIGETDINNYLANLEKRKIRIGPIDALTALKAERYDIVFFEFYHRVQNYIKFIRFLQPQARVLIDSVDIHYNRMFSKASLTGDAADLRFAEQQKQDELAAYRQGDLLIVVSKNEELLLKQDAPNIHAAVLANIHRIPEFIPAKPPFNKLLFVGSFKHEPNIDAVLYFCHEVWPLLLAMNKEFTLEVIGPDAPETITNLASENLFIRGFVENLDEAYRHADISVAPLRFGAGIKGKVGEAMSFGLPVVTTEVGAEGFGLTPGENVLIAQTAEDFAKSILRLSEEYGLYEKLSRNGYNFIRSNFSEESAREKLSMLLEQALTIAPKRFSWLEKALFTLCFPYYLYDYYLKPKLQRFYNTYIGWRFKHSWNN